MGTRDDDASCMCTSSVQNVITVGATLDHPAAASGFGDEQLYLFRYTDGSGQSHSRAVSVCQGLRNKSAGAHFGAVTSEDFFGGVLNLTTERGRHHYAKRCIGASLATPGESFHEANGFEVRGVSSTCAAASAPDSVGP
jgi:hypothetical protein